MLLLIAIPSYAFASPSLNMTLNAAQTTPATTIKDNNGNILWQFISNTFGNIATLISQKIVIYNSGLTHIRGYQLPDQNTTLVGLNTSNTWPKTNTFNSLVLNNGQFINGQNEIMAINYSSPSTSYVIFNATTNAPIASGTDAGLVLQKGINALSSKRGGLIYIHSGSYTATTHVQINKTLTLMGANYGGAAFNGTVIYFNVGGVGTNGIDIGSPNFVRDAVIQDIQFARTSQNSAKYIMNINNFTLHTILERVTFVENGKAAWPELGIIGNDAIFLSHVQFFRNSNLAGNETIPSMLYTKGNIQLFLDDVHFAGPSGTSSAPTGYELDADRQVKISQSTFDTLNKPIVLLNDTGFGHGDLVVNNVGFYNDAINKITDNNAHGFNHISGKYENYGLTPSGNFTTNMMGSSFDSTNNYTDATDVTKKFNWDITGITTKHRQTFKVPNVNDTLSLQPAFNFTSPSNQTGTSSTTVLVQNGGFATLTPRYSTNATVAVQGSIYNSVAGSGCIVSLRTSSSNMGLNGAALAGSAVGNDFKYTSPTAQANGTLSLDATVTGLTAGQKQFFDLAFKSVTSGNCKIINLNWNIREQ